MIITVLKHIVTMLFLCSALGCQTATMPAKPGTSMADIKQTLVAGMETKPTAASKRTALPSVMEQALQINVEAALDPDSMAPPEKRFDIVADNVPAKAFFVGLVEDTKQNIIVHPKVTGSLSLRLKQVTIDEVLEMVRQVYGYGFEKYGKVIKILPAGLQTRSYKVNYLNLSRDGSSTTEIASSGINSSSSGSTTTDTDSSNTSGGGSSSTLNSQVHSINKTDFWTELYDSLNLILGQEEGRKISISPMAGIIVVQAMPDELARIEQYLKQAEASLNRQVILEAKILEVELNDVHKSGINWGLVSKHFQVSQRDSDLLKSTASATAVPQSITDTADNPQSINFTQGVHLAPGVPQLTKPFGGILSLGFNYKRLTSFIELLASQGNVHILSSPRISTLNNQKALIKVGKDDYFVTNVSTTTTIGTGGGASTPNVEFEPFFTGIALDVTPQIDENEVVTLHIHPTVSTISEATKTVTLGTQIATYPLASSSIRETDSIVRAKNGEIVVIGGLMQNTVEDLAAGVPLLKDIPYLGKLFKQHRQIGKKTELVFLIRPILLTQPKIIEILDSAYKRFDNLDAGFDFDADLDGFGASKKRRI